MRLPSCSNCSSCPSALMPFRRGGFFFLLPRSAMEFQDRAIQCLDCKNEFIFTAGEQEFYERKGFREVPKRCKPCRDMRKARRDGGDGGGMADGYGNGNGNGNGYGNRAPRGGGGGGGN